MACNLCDSDRTYFVYKKRRVKESAGPSPSAYTISESHLEKPDTILCCMTCGLVYAVPEVSGQEIDRGYSKMVDPDYVREEKGRTEQARIVLSRVAKFKNRGKLLDVGCGPGFFLAEAKRQGWEVAGVDLSAWAKQYCKEHYGIEIAQGGLEQAAWPDQSFDVVVMNDVLEHLTDPKGTLREIRRILKNDGVLYISTPDINSFFSRVLRARWWGINKYHLFYFSRKTIERLFEVVGLRKLQYSSYPRVFSVNYWAMRLEPYPAFVHKAFRWVTRFNGSGEGLLKIDLFDQIGVIARKVARLDSIAGETGAGREPAPPRMKVTAVLPAFNAEKTLERTVADIPKEAVSEIILVDDASRDHTVAIAEKLGLKVFRHEKNRGYGANQKTCYEKALESGADIVVMVHPDYQYDPKIIPQLVEPIQRGRADAVFGSRMMKGGALEGGMPMWKHNANILLTAFENVMLGTYLTEYHSGFRAYSAKLLKRVRYKENSDGFLFDTEIIIQAVANRFKIEEIPIRTRYFEEASTIKLWPSLVYGLGIVGAMAQYFLHAKGIWTFRKFEPAD
ncbi:MAG: methyltransferase domain-containing protein [Candidatus Omnitrophota bacterium]